METANPQEIKKHVRTYITVFVALLTLTIITVTVSYLHLNIPAAITVALLIATIKGSLVASYFMHLISEKKIIYATLVLTAVFFIALMWLPIFHHANPVIYKNVP
ncbi:MAG: cytochrome C oxidase subunit IV family protein [Ignavibacteria bacterium]|nr:cytochrome C oxidase subunit IV family protein [Ignavibacteria bacterium]MBI3765090.1 cytochrome C oxidase subunit IV family protein [Ignavibacteriales bacterium]